MANTPSIKIHSCSEDVNNVEYVDIDYTAAQMFNIPKITTLLDGNVNVFISNVTQTSARLNFSAKYTGVVRYTVISIK